MTEEGPRIDALEMRIAEQERTLGALDDAVAAQWNAIDALRLRLERALERLGEAERLLPADPEPPPPHY